MIPINAKVVVATVILGFVSGFWGGCEWEQGQKAKLENEQIRKLNADIIYYQERVNHADQKLQEAKRDIDNAGERVVVKHIDRVRNITPDCLPKTTANGGDDGAARATSVERDRQQLELAIRNLGEVGRKCDINAATHNATIEAISK
jgi:hypothetical protein